MKVTGIAGRVLLALMGLVAAAGAIADIYLVAVHRLAISAELACILMWNIRAATWIAAMAWSRRAASRPPALEEASYWLAPALGLGLLGFGSVGTHFAPLWRTPGAIGWALAGACGAGLVFTWWARIALGSLWSGSVSRKEDHAIIQSGPYRLVRHPIYTGLIAAALAQAIVVGQAANLAGALLITVGFWLKARFEERFLSQELGAGAYSEFRRRTPMLVPFWPMRG